MYGVRVPQEHRALAIISNGMGVLRRCAHKGLCTGVLPQPMSLQHLAACDNGWANLSYD